MPWQTTAMQMRQKLLATTRCRHITFVQLTRIANLGGNHTFGQDQSVVRAKGRPEPTQALAQALVKAIVRAEKSLGAIEEAAIQIVVDGMTRILRKRIAILGVRSVARPSSAI